MLKIHLQKSEKRLLYILLILPLVLLTLGIYHGLMQTLYRSGMISQTSFAALEYYQGLTLHGVINALVLTTFFAVAFGHVCMSYYTKIKMHMPTAWISAIMMVTGTLLAAYCMLTGQASVLFTFYAPMKAHPLHYIGNALLITGSWVAFFGWITMYLKWRKEHKDERTPLAVTATLANFTMWFVSSMAVIYSLLFLLLPWSMGITQTVNIPLTRTLFWFFGHALVYFWLLPVYLMYYVMLPTLAGGKAYSDNAGKLAFFLLMIFSIPVGGHHQFGEPSITGGVKFFQSVLTFGVAIPSLITAFTIAAALEYAAWKKGNRGRNYLSWLWKLPYFEKERYLFAYLIAGLALFIFGGLTGIPLASTTLNSLFHNTAFIPGHFHMTVAGPVFLGIIGMSLYLLERLSGKEIRLKRIAVVVPYLWAIGMFIFSTGLMVGGMRGEPRRTNMGISYMDPDSPLYRPDWVWTTGTTVIGGVILFAAAGLFFLVLLDLLLTKKSRESYVSFPTYRVIHQEKVIPFLNSFKPWLVIMFVLILLAYIPALMNVFKFTGREAPPYSPNNPTPLEISAPEPAADQEALNLE